MEKLQKLEQRLQESLLRNQELVLKNTFLQSDNRQLQTKLAKLSDELLYLRRTLFGRSSERYIQEDPNQLKLDFYGLVQLGKSNSK